MPVSNAPPEEAERTPMHIFLTPRDKMLYPSCIAAVALLAAGAEPALPKIERDFRVVSPTKKAGQPLAQLIPPESITRIILANSRTYGNPRTEFDPDELIARAFKSSTKGSIWGLLATERTASEFLIVTKKGDIYRLVVLCDRRQKGAVAALLVYGKGFSCRYDLGH